MFTILTRWYDEQEEADKIGIEEVADEADVVVKVSAYYTSDRIPLKDIYVFRGKRLNLKISLTEE